jgi:hypothetical protein
VSAPIPHDRYFRSNPFCMSIRVCGNLERPLFCAKDIFRVVQVRFSENTLEKLFPAELYETVEFQEPGKIPQPLQFLTMDGVRKAAGYSTTDQSAFLAWLEGTAIPSLSAITAGIPFSAGADITADGILLGAFAVESREGVPGVELDLLGKSSLKLTSAEAMDLVEAIGRALKQSPQQPSGHEVRSLASGDLLVGDPPLLIHQPDTELGEEYSQKAFGSILRDEQRGSGQHTPLSSGQPHDPNRQGQNMSPPAFQDTRQPKPGTSGDNISSHSQRVCPDQPGQPESPTLAAILADASTALDTLTNSPASAEWLAQLGQQAAELIRKECR